MDGSARPHEGGLERAHRAGEEGWYVTLYLCYLYGKFGAAHIMAEVQVVVVGTAPGKSRQSMIRDA